MTRVTITEKCGWTRATPLFLSTYQENTRGRQERLGGQARESQRSGERQLFGNAVGGPHTVRLFGEQVSLDWQLTTLPDFLVLAVLHLHLLHTEMPLDRDSIPKSSPLRF